MTTTSQSVRERVLEIIRANFGASDLAGFIEGWKLNALGEDEDVDKLMSDFEVEFSIGDLQIMDMTLNELVAYIMKYVTKADKRKLTHPEMHERLVPVYLKLFGTVIGDSIIRGGKSYLRQHHAELTEPTAQRMFKEIGEAAGIELDDDLKLYIMSAGLNDVVSRLTFTHNQKHHPV